MTGIFYTISCPRDVVDKSSELGAGTSKTVSAYNPLDDLTGYIIVSADVANSNYVKLSLTGKDRFYFVTAREIQTGGMCRLILEEDVLMTWKDSIMSTPGIIGRSNVGSSKDFQSDIPLLSFSRITEITDASFDYGTNSGLNFVLVSASQSQSAAEAGGGIIQDYEGHAGGGAGVHW